VPFSREEFAIYHLAMIGLGTKQASKLIDLKSYDEFKTYKNEQMFQLEKPTQAYSKIHKRNSLRLLSVKFLQMSNTQLNHPPQ
jgi:hypothetical protein